MPKSVDSSQIAKIDPEPTNIQGWNPDPEHRVKLAHLKDGSRKFLYDNEVIRLDDAVGMLTGKESIPKRMSGFTGIGGGKLRRPYETEEEWLKRIKDQ